MINLLLVGITLIACLIAGLAITIAISHLNTANEALAEADAADARAHNSETALKIWQAHQATLNNLTTEKQENT